MAQQNDITFFAKTNFRNQERVFGIKADDRRRHMYLIGKTGMGKTNLLENLAIQDIQNGHGIAFIDPHGDTAEKLIKAIPSHRINDVIYFNPADQDFPIAFNVMEKVSPEYRHLVASGLVGVFKKIWADSWGPRLEYILRNAILALLEYPGSTLLGVTRILVDKSYRERVVEKITDPVVRSFWVDEFSKWDSRVLQEVISPIQNKVGQFLSSALIRNIVGQTTSSFDVRQVMDERKILIMNLSKGRLGEDNSALLGAMMITKIQLAAMGRVDIPEETRADFYLYVDEFQNFATESFANILSEARKYRLNLILANQYVTQIAEEVRDAIFGNAGSIISFRVGGMDAEFLEKEFEPVFMMNDIVNLPKYQIYLKLMIDGIAGDAFSATVLPPIKIEGDPETERKIIQASRERYTSNKEDVEDKIRRWSGMLSPEERQALVKKELPVVRPTVVSRPAAVSVVSKLKEEVLPKTKPVAGPAAAVFGVGRHEGTKTPLKESASVIPKQEESIYSKEQASALLQATLVTNAPETPPKFVPPLAPKKELSTDLDAFEKEEQAKQQQEGESKPQRIEGQRSNTETLQELVEVTPEKVLYQTKCATCETDIEVPFVPDGKRPTFCKDCLRDYQRATAKARNEIVKKQEATPQSVQNTKNIERSPEAPRHQVKHSQVYAPTSQPVSLAQAQHIEPKRFKTLRKRPEVNLGELREMIGAAHKRD
ncbi:MAG: type IV secretion system DNA-binding domain-containing protein [Candidatus Moranbacteria bacterium]|nr:type IV secretion system DNA-binding domain-containing protein [Candidatus Moranbacteria bacterium]